MIETLQSEPGCCSSLKVVVLYDELESAIRAKRLLARVAANAAWEGTFDNVFWRFDMMSQPLAVREASESAADADMILLVAERVVVPPVCLLEWLETWATTRRIQDAALVAWCHRRAGGSSSEAVETLRKLAGRHGLEWLCAEELERETA